MAASLSTPTRLALCLLGLLLVYGAVTIGRSVSAAQNDSNATGTPTSTTAQNAQAGTFVNLPQQTQDEKGGIELKDLNVSAVIRADTTDKKEVTRAGLYNTIQVKIDNLARWMQNQNNDPHKFFLYIDSYPLKAIRGRPVSPASDDLLFDLERTSDEDTQKAWRKILNRPALLPPKPRPVQVSVAYDNSPNNPGGVLVGSAVTQFPLIDINPFWSKIFAVFLSVAFTAFVLFAIRSDMLRDIGPQPTGVNKRGQANRKPFSLGRTQMAFWFFLVITSYVFIWMVTGDVNTITVTVLGLIGISATTALGSVLIDNGKSSDAQSQFAALQAEQAALQTRINELNAKANATPPTATPEEVAELQAKRIRLQEVGQQLVALPPPVTPATAPASQNFLTDILTGSEGVSFHRFQVGAWTITLGFIFLAQVFNSLLMPEFDTMLLALMGISSGTYLGFKYPEK
jgi:low affinity Fe/Cu permease